MAVSLNSKTIRFHRGAGAVEGRGAGAAPFLNGDAHLVAGADWGLPLHLIDTGQPLKLAWRVQSLGISAPLDHQQTLLQEWAELMRVSCGYVGVLEPTYAAALPVGVNVIDVLAVRHSVALPLDSLFGPQRTRLAQHYGFPVDTWDSSDGWEQLRAAGHVLGQHLGLHWLCPFTSTHPMPAFDEILQHGLVLLGTPYDVATRFVLDVFWFHLQSVLDRREIPPLVMTSGAFGLPRSLAEEVCHVAFSPTYPTTSTIEWRNGQQILMTPAKMYQWPLVDAAPIQTEAAAAIAEQTKPDWADVRYEMERLWYAR